MWTGFWSRTAEMGSFDLSFWRWVISTSQRTIGTERAPDPSEMAHKNWNTIQPPTKSHCIVETTCSEESQCSCIIVESEQELCFSRRLGLASWRPWKEENIGSTSIVELLHESSFSCIEELKDAPTTIEILGPDNTVYDNNKFILKPFLNKSRNMNFSDLHDVELMMNRDDGRSTECTKRSGQKSWISVQ